MAQSKSQTVRKSQIVYGHKAGRVLAESCRANRSNFATHTAYAHTVGHGRRGGALRRPGPLQPACHAAVHPGHGAHTPPLGFFFFQGPVTDTLRCSGSGFADLWACLHRSDRAWPLFCESVPQVYPCIIITYLGQGALPSSATFPAPGSNASQLYIYKVLQVLAIAVRCRWAPSQVTCLVVHAGKRLHESGRRVRKCQLCV